MLATLQDIEKAILHFITCTAHHPTLGKFFRAIQSDRIGIPLTLLALSLIARRDRWRAWRALIAGASAVGLGMLIASLCWAIIPRERPPHAYERLLRTDAALATCASQPEAFPIRDRVNSRRSFPSRHAITVGALATALWLASRVAGMLAILYGVLVLWGRMYVGRHWPTDLLAGVVLGSVLAVLTWRLVPRVHAHVRRVFASA